MPERCRQNPRESRIVGAAAAPIVKVLLASFFRDHAAADELVKLGLSRALQNAGCQLDHIVLWSADDDGAALKNLAAYRLMRIGEQSDALLCLDVESTILRHPRKFACTVAGGFGGLDGTYSGNVLSACVRECAGLIVAGRLPKCIAGELRRQAIHIDQDADLSDAKTWRAAVGGILK